MKKIVGMGWNKEEIKLQSKKKSFIYQLSTLLILLMGYSLLATYPEAILSPGVVKKGDEIKVEYLPNGWKKGAVHINGPAEFKDDHTLVVKEAGYIWLSVQWYPPENDPTEKETTLPSNKVVSIEVRLNLLTYRLPIDFVIKNEIQPKGEAEKLLEELNSRISELKAYLESISPELWTREQILESLQKTIDVREKIVTIINFPNKCVMFKGTIILYGIEGFKIPIYVSTFPEKGFPVLLTEISDSLLSTTTYGKEVGNCSGKVDITNFIDFYFLTGNYGKFNVLATEQKTKANSELGNIIIINDFEEDLALLAIKEYKTDEKYIEKIVEDINDTADLCQSVALIAQALALSSDSVNRICFSAESLLLNSGAFLLRRTARKFKTKASNLILSALQDTINKIQIVPEKAPVNEAENDSWKAMNNPPWSDYETLP